ncbi:MAG: hypothetical protein SVC26_02475 [Pseudomonadota bacterium]|nr:hypothetical protein [Pseudomonadota bacterium]
MNTYDLDDLSEIPAHILEAEAAEKFAADKKEAEEKIYRVVRFMQANPHFDARALAEKFDLHWKVKLQYDNGLGRIGFCTDLSLRFEVFEIIDSLRSWFHPSALYDPKKKYRAEQA